MRKMVMAVVSRDQTDHVLDTLINSGYGATFTDSRGGMLRQTQQMLFIAVEADKIDDVVSIIKQCCHTQVEVGGREAGRAAQPGIAEVGYAVVFVWDLERFETY